MLPHSSCRLRRTTAMFAAVLTLLLLTASPVAAQEPRTPPIGGERLGEPGLVIDAPPGVPLPPAIPAEAYVIADGDTGEILAAKAPHVLHAPASTLKTLTALTALRKTPLDATYTARFEDAAMEGSKAGLVEGSTYTLRDLMYGMFLPSGNDAANAVANMSDGGRLSFLQEMNATARQLRAYDTTAMGPSGLDEPGQFSSAYDLALIGRAALRRPEIREFSSARKYAMPAAAVPGQPRGTFDIWTRQRFVLRYDGAFGIKNGFTTQARFTLIAASTREDRTILITLMKAGSNIQGYAAALSDWAYTHGSQVRPVGQLVEPLPSDEEEISAFGAAAGGGAPRRTTVSALPTALGVGAVGAVLVGSYGWVRRRRSPDAPVRVSRSARTR